MGSHHFGERETISAQRSSERRISITMFSTPASGGKKGLSRDGYDVFVGNLPDTTTEDQVGSFFERFGEVISVTLRQNYGFVRFATEEQHNNAMGASPVDFFGSKVSVKKGLKKGMGAKKKEDGPPNFGNKPKPNFSGNKPDLVSNHQASSQGNSNRPGFKVEKRVQLVVSHVEGPVTFWAQDVANSEMIADVTMKLQSLCSSVFPSVPRPSHDKVYAAKFSEDDNWYRCKVLKFHSNSQVEVLYIDYGNSEVRNDKDLVELPPGLQQPAAQSARYALYGLIACHPDRTTTGFAQGKTFFKSLVEQKIISADVMSSEQSSSCTPVILYAEDQDINQMMLDKGHAEMRSSTKPSSGGAPGSYKGKQQNNENQNRQSQPKTKLTTRPHQTHQPHVPKLMQGSGASGGWDGPLTQSPPMWLATKGANDGTGDGPSNADVDGLKTELTRARGRLSEANANAEKQRIRYQQQIDRLTRENNQMLEEKNSAAIQLSKTKGKLKAAETKVSQLSHDDFNSKLERLLKDITRVRALRGRFPTKDSQNDLVENGLVLLMQDDPLKGSNIMTFVADVQTSCASFDVIQKRIRHAKSVEEISDIIEARNEARCELHKKVEEFLEAVEKFPIDSSASHFKNMVGCLGETYEPYMRGPFDPNCMLTLEEIEFKWSKWKAENPGRDNSAEIQEVRTAVNTIHNKVDSLLTQLQAQLRFNPDNASEVNSSCLHLPRCITGLQEAINREISITDLEDKQDVNLEIRAIVRSLVQLCTERRNALDILKGYKEEYEALKQKLGPWLKNRPDLLEVQSMRKNIRSCNSKLRHKLADKLDLEEADDSTSEELQEVKDSITKLRNELQEALSKQDSLISNIQEVILDQFPELVLEYADLGIQTSAEYSGLVKEGRSLDHFDLEQQSKGVYKSTFCGKPIILKEYLVDDSVGVSKQEFLERVQAYHRAQSPYVMDLEAVFFTKNERQVIIQVPCYESTLAKKVEEGELPFEVVQKLLRSVTEGVAALHKQGIIHGAVNATNIFMAEEDRPVINCIDFTKSPEQRIVSSNTDFAPPEILQGLPASLKADVFSLGVLTFWLNFPGAAPVEEWPIEARDTLLQQFVVQAKAKKPSERPSAEELLTFAFFRVRMVVSNDILQLRMNNNSCTKSETGGILKNCSPLKESPPPDVINIEPLKTSVSESADTSMEVEIVVNNGDGLNDTNCSDFGQDDLTVTPESVGPNDDDKSNKYANKLASQVMFHTEGTPTLLCTPMDTPSNTPIESENNTPCKNNAASDLQSSAVQASLETLLTKKNAEDGLEEEEVAGLSGHDSDDADMPDLETQ